MRFVSALDPSKHPQLHELEQRMRRFYANPAYHNEWIRGANSHWQAGAHDAQLALAQRIPAGARILEIGCGDASGAHELLQRLPVREYCGVDITIPRVLAGQLKLAAASGLALPFPAEHFDVVLSMFTIEHTLFPNTLLDEAWRVLRAGGTLLLIAPDFLNNAMASERIGFSYGTGRDKLRRAHVLDAALTLIDSRIRLPWQRHRRRRALAKGSYTFPVLLQPRCLTHAGFVTDCDAVYPSSLEEISNYMRARHRLRTADVFFRDAHTFGLELTKP
jgi:ubiquinone/menaquinone biosynthesis C-methylase UbiE